jgi:predicted Zn-dependent protease
MLLNIALGNDSSGLKSMAKQMATGAAGLAWSRDYEYEADSMGVEFIYSIRSTKNYQCTALTDFFKRMEADGKGTAGTPEWLSTHPLDANRISHVDGLWQRLNSPTGELFGAEYQTALSVIPK